MARLSLTQGGTTRRVCFDPPRPLDGVLEELGIYTPHPCGGRGRCGKCSLRLEGAVSPPNETEVRAGCRLLCQAVLLGDAAVWLAEPGPVEQIETGAGMAAPPPPGEGALGAAVDLGTTTVALRLCRLDTGETLATAARENPQTAVAADVMGRVGAALGGKGPLLQGLVLSALEALLETACAQARVPAERVERLVLTCNTTMLYLLTGADPRCLAQAPFRADCLFDFETTVLGRKAYLPPCVSAFVGADLLCAALERGLDTDPGPVLLCDVGTNGELALWKQGRLYTASTAAGPAFEGAGISCGCPSVRGAIDRVWVEEGQVRCHTIGEVPATGLCGSGLLDAVAAFLRLGLLDETGRPLGERLPLAEGLALLPGDIRAVQLAKAAVAAGIQTLLERTGTRAEDLVRFELCGGFGAHLDPDSAAAIGLFPPSLVQKAHIAGNAALAGAALLLRDNSARDRIRRLAHGAVHVELGGDPDFQEYFISHLYFPHTG